MIWIFSRKSTWKSNRLVSAALPGFLSVLFIWHLWRLFYLLLREVYLVSSLSIMVILHSNISTPENFSFLSVLAVFLCTACQWFATICVDPSQVTYSMNTGCVQYNKHVSFRKNYKHKGKSLTRKRHLCSRITFRSHFPVSLIVSRLICMCSENSSYITLHPLTLCLFFRLV